MEGREEGEGKVETKGGKGRDQWYAALLVLTVPARKGYVLQNESRLAGENSVGPEELSQTIAPVEHILSLMERPGEAQPRLPVKHAEPWLNSEC